MNTSSSAPVKGSEASGVYVATVSVPGYLPEGEPYVCDTAQGAWEWLAEERERDLDLDAELCTLDGDGSDSVAEEIEGYIESPEPGSVHGYLPSDGEHALGLVYAVTRVDHLDYPHEPGYLHGCPACELRCNCTVDSAECVFDGEHEI